MAIKKSCPLNFIIERANLSTRYFYWIDCELYLNSMLKEYLRILKEHSDDVYGVGARKTLSLYTLLSIACVVVPVTFFLVVILLKLF